MIPPYLQESSWSHQHKERCSELALTAPTKCKCSLKGKPRLSAYSEFHHLAERQSDVKPAIPSARRTPSSQYLPNNSSSTQGNLMALPFAMHPSSKQLLLYPQLQAGAAVKLCLTLKKQFQALCPLGNTHKCSSEVHTARTVWKNKKSPTIPGAHMISGGIRVADI